MEGRPGIAATTSISTTRAYARPDLPPLRRTDRSSPKKEPMTIRTNTRNLLDSPPIPVQAKLAAAWTSFSSSTSSSFARCRTSRTCPNRAPASRTPAQASRSPPLGRSSGPCSTACTCVTRAAPNCSSCQFSTPSTRRRLRRLEASYLRSDAARSDTRGLLASSRRPARRRSIVDGCASAREICYWSTRGRAPQPTRRS
jgi:hypothetical protein